MTLFARGFRWIINHTVGAGAVRGTIVRLADLFGIDLLATGYRRIGILNYETPELTGETFLIRTLLPRVIAAREPVILDVGANVGDITVDLRRAFPAARIVAVEPNPVTYDRLSKAVAGLNVETLRAGMGASEGTGVLHCYRNDPVSGHASMFRDMFDLYKGYGIEGADDLQSIEFPIRTLDATCRELGIEQIDYLKIDVEGYEAEVLKGARALLEAKKIATIQFEFTDCNVLSRTFMRDFYELLQGFTFFRLAPDHLVPLGPYAARLEVFQFQNILAVRDDVLALPAWQPFRGGSGRA